MNLIVIWAEYKLFVTLLTLQLIYWHLGFDFWLLHAFGMQYRYLLPKASIQCLIACKSGIMNGMWIESQKNATFFDEYTPSLFMWKCKRYPDKVIKQAGSFAVISKSLLETRHLPLL